MLTFFFEGVSSYCINCIRLDLMCQLSKTSCVCLFFSFFFFFSLCNNCTIPETQLWSRACGCSVYWRTCF